MGKSWYRWVIAINVIVAQLPRRGKFFRICAFGERRVINVRNNLHNPKVSISGGAWQVHIPAWNTVFIRSCVKQPIHYSFSLVLEIDRFLLLNFSLSLRLPEISIERENKRVTWNELVTSALVRSAERKWRILRPTFTLSGTKAKRAKTCDVLSNL